MKLFKYALLANAVLLSCILSGCSGANENAAPTEGVDLTAEPTVAFDAEEGAQPGQLIGLEPVREAEGMTLAEASDYVRAIRADTFGLSGESMEDYHFYIMNGMTFVNDFPCMRLKIYDGDTPEGTNHFLGIYFLSSDGQHLYRLDQPAQTVEELPISLLDG